jgi:hypothetical protein
MESKFNNMGLSVDEQLYGLHKHVFYQQRVFKCLNLTNRSNLKKMTY